MSVLGKKGDVSEGVFPGLYPQKEALLTMKAQHRNLMTTCIIHIILYPHFLSMVLGEAGYRHSCC